MRVEYGRLIRGARKRGEAAGRELMPEGVCPYGLAHSAAMAEAWRAGWREKTEARWQEIITEHYTDQRKHS